MSGFANTIASLVLNHLFGKTTYSAPGTYYIGLSTKNPGDAGDMTGEPVGGNYARVAVTNDTVNFPAAVDGSKANGTKIEFPEATGNWGTITHFFLADALSAGNVIASGALEYPKQVESGDAFYFDAGDLTIKLD